MVWHNVCNSMSNVQLWWMCANVWQCMGKKALILSVVCSACSEAKEVALCGVSRDGVSGLVHMNASVMHALHHLL